MPGSKKAGGAPDIERRRRNVPEPDMPATVRKMRGLDANRKRAKVISFDEMWTYVGVRKGKRRRSVWIWTAVVEESDGQRRADFEEGSRERETFLSRRGAAATPMRLMGGFGRVLTLWGREAR